MEENEKKYIYLHMFVQLNNFAVHLKLRQFVNQLYFNKTSKNKKEVSWYQLTLANIVSHM